MPRSYPVEPPVTPKRASRTVNSIVFAMALVAGTSGCATGGTGGGFGASASASRGAPWTIRCLEVPTEGGAGTMRQLADALRSTSGIRAGDVFLRQDDDGFSRLYYGTYFRRSASGTAQEVMPAELRRDLELIRTLGVEGGRRLFVGAIPVRKPEPDVGNPAWNLRNVSATYSLQVAVFEPTEEFYEYKQAAADFCALLRERGYEAYYYHAPASSSVTVGRFGPDAVVRHQTMIDGRTRYVTEYSLEVRRLQQEELLAHNLLNGAIYRVRNETGLSEPVPSRLVEVPSRIGP